MVVPDSRPLAGCYVISLRPAGAHAALRRAATRLGAGFIPLSSLRIVLDKDAATAAQLGQALQAEHVVVTSPNAVRAAQALQPLRAAAGQRWHAVGAGTAAALRRAGIDHVSAPSRMDSEGLLALPGLEALADTTLALLTAPGGRGLLQPAFESRGARVLRADLYRREPIRPRADALQRLLDSAPAPLWLALSSGEALQNLLAAVPPDALRRLRQARAACASQRLAVLAQQEGFSGTVVADGPRPAQLLAAMVRAQQSSGD
ncbi:MAG: uroporphyrinogen-III synthase [Pseudoxanthomonas suwonensis]|nr:uroporphyrinogen-III synthase [Pseudoxanthomonas suwonensis]